MIKKIFVGVLIAAVFILLVLGAVNRTLAKVNDHTPLSLEEKTLENKAEKQSTHQNIQLAKNTSNSKNTGSNGNSGQNGTGNNANQSAACENSGQNGAGNKANQSTTDGNSNINGHGNNGNNSSENNLGVGEANQVDWIDLNGELTEIESDLWIITLSDGSQIELEGRALSYLIDQGFSASVGDQIAMSGFYEDDHFKIGQIVNQNTGQESELRTLTGQPLWSGGGRGNN